ncbi:uncharacterized protein LOC143600059 [Bidens hawaiensis]|uniref:uncharacterized protein LOC143600059 n=1 Tax=Bidens hawaiensis TaxID=980011 RepID=UPI0040497AE2
MAQKRGRISWKQDGLEKTFLEACIEQITLHGREGSSLKLISWRNVAEKLKAEYNLIVDQRQMKNRYDHIKAKFAAWSKLKNKTGNLMDPDDEIIVFIFLCWHWLHLVSGRIERIRDLNSALTGHAYTQELLHGYSTQCHEIMRLSRDAFVLLCNHFKQKSWLQSSSAISVEEKLTMFFTVLGHYERFRMVKRRFQHSTETIHRCFHEVLNAMMNFSREVIVPTASNAITNTSASHRRLKLIFPGAIGVLDGTLVHAVVPADQQTRYRGRGKGECFQNVLAICDFDMIFTFVWAGWEGVAHDSRVLKEVAFNPTSDFPFPPPGI